MTEPTLIPTTLDGIAALADATTRKPWRSLPLLWDDGEQERRTVEVLSDTTADAAPLIGVHDGQPYLDPADAEFIAHSRTLVPRLVEALRWLDDVGLWCEGDTSDIRPTITRILAGDQPCPPRRVAAQVRDMAAVLREDVVDAILDWANNEGPTGLNPEHANALRARLAALPGLTTTEETR